MESNAAFAITICSDLQFLPLSQAKNNREGEGIYGREVWDIGVLFFVCVFMYACVLSEVLPSLLC